jgi:hypothetical protein
MHNNVAATRRWACRLVSRRGLAEVAASVAVRALDYYRGDTTTYLISCQRGTARVNLRTLSLVMPTSISKAIRMCIR